MITIFLQSRHVSKFVDLYEIKLNPTVSELVFNLLLTKIRNTSLYVIFYTLLPLNLTSNS